MNELRMYVEHLFEGRVLTAENIELRACGRNLGDRGLRP